MKMFTSRQTSKLKVKKPSNKLIISIGKNIWDIFLEMITNHIEIF